jgi:hypothetical protein
MKRPRIVTEFEYNVTANHKITVRASARRVNEYEATGLTIELFTQHGEEYDQVLDEDTNLDLEEEAIRELTTKSFELKFRE